MDVFIVFVASLLLVIYTTRGLDNGRTNVDVFSKKRVHYLCPPAEFVRYAT